MDPSYAEKYASYEQNHWWFRARRHILRQLLAKEIRWRASMEVLEIGVGPGLNLYSVYPPECNIQGLEPDAENAALANERGPIPVTVGTLEDMPAPLVNRSYDLITMFDVLEHIRDDHTALKFLKKLLAPQGYLVLTVPAHQWLWSQHDLVNHHFRRYSKKGLTALLRKSGFTIQRSTFFNTLLLPGVAATRLVDRVIRRRPSGKSDFDRSSAGMSSLLYKIFALEAHWLTRCSFPSGVSIFIVARV